MKSLEWDREEKNNGSILDNQSTLRRIRESDLKMVEGGQMSISHCIRCGRKVHTAAHKALKTQLTPQMLCTTSQNLHREGTLKHDPSLTSYSGSSSFRTLLPHTTFPNQGLKQFHSIVQPWLHSCALCLRKLRKGVLASSLTWKM